jgi:hypothetical protein
MQIMEHLFSHLKIVLASPHPLIYLFFGISHYCIFAQCQPTIFITAKKQIYQIKTNYIMRFLVTQSH